MAEIEMEKVIKGLDSCARWMSENDNDACYNCPYHHSLFNYDDNDCIATVNNDAIALLKKQQEEIKCLRGMLKEQEPVVPQKHYNNKADLLYACGKCRNDLKPNNRNAKFCWFCGQAVKWR